VSAGPTRHTASLRIPADERRGRAVGDAVAVEVGEIDDDRSRATVAREDGDLIVTVAAADLVALRAGLNSWLRLVEVGERVAAAVDAPDADD
jgi:KEOPS complex subunit Pcc1